MKLTVLMLCCIALALGAFACTQSAPTNSPAPIASAPAASPTATPDQLAAARIIFTKDCEACHGETGEGGLVKIDNKRLKVPSFKSERAMNKTDEQFIKQITGGGDGMPAFKDKLKPAEMQEMVRFVRKQFQGK